MTCPIALLGYKPATSFNPLVDLTPLYMTQTDSSSSSGGFVDSITDMVASYVFSNTGTARPISDTATVAGHTVWKIDGSTTARKWLTLLNATLAGSLDGPVACSMCTYIKVVSMISLGTPDLIGHTLSTAAYGNPSIRYGLTTTGSRMVDSGATRQNIFVRNFSFSGGWQLFSMTFDGNATTKFWLDGVQQGADVVLLPTGAMTGMTSVVLGEATAIGAGVTREYYVGGHFVCLGQLTSQNMIDLSAWYAGTFV